MNAKHLIIPGNSRVNHKSVTFISRLTSAFTGAAGGAGIGAAFGSGGALAGALLLAVLMYFMAAPAAD